jgi:simple sugar transport system permease protein
MLRFEKRENLSTKLKVFIPLVSIITGLLIGAIAILFAKINPLTAYKAILVGAFGSKYTFTETLVFATPLILISVGLILVFKMNFWNIGAYGQYIMGALLSSYFALFLPTNIPKLLLLTIMTLAGLLGGALWALIPAVLKVYWDVNEVISTLLLNYVALYILQYFMYGPWRDPRSHGFPLSKMFADNAQLPKIISNSRVHLGLIFGIVAAFIVWFIIKKTKLGYETRIIGGSKDAAHYAGINVPKDIIIAMMISGGLAGLAGMAQISGVIHLLQIQINPDYGYTAIIAAWLSYLEPFTAIIVSILLGALAAGGYQIQITMQVPFGIISVIESVILFALIGSEILLRYTIHLEKRRKM